MNQARSSHIRLLLIAGLAIALVSPLSAARRSAKKASPKWDLNTEMNHFYRLKGKDRAAAKQKLEEILKNNPDNAAAHAEMGYLLLDEGKREEALNHFRTAEAHAPDDARFAMQSGYLLDMGNRKKEAYQEFDRASKSGDEKLREEACIATINLSPVVRKQLPEPYFADLYFSPLYSSRFDDGIFSLNLRAGINIGTRREWEFYGGFRGVRDTESRGGNAPEIFSDNVGVFAVGARYIPIPRVPLSLYAEVGRGYDLIDRNRKRWRDDVRAGALFFQGWGRGPRCPSDWVFPFRHIGNLYADASYYSRYDDNWIGYLRIREGLRVVEINRSAADAYIHLGGVIDANDEFFNNLVEIGPGVQVIPDQRLNIALRYYVVKGNYLKVNSPSPNPYGVAYTDHRWEAECYWRF